MTAISYRLRHWIWRLVSKISGGLTVTGKWGVSGGCIVVANHSSHADTAVLLAALPPKAKPVFGAAADYWFEVPVRRFIATSLAGVLPVRRSGGGSYDTLLAAVRPARHTAASLMIASGANVKTVQSQLGHKTATMTLDQYGHLFPDDLDDVADKMDDLVSRCAQNVPTKETGQGENTP